MTVSPATTVTMRLPSLDWDRTDTQYRPWVTDVYTTAGGIGSSRGRGATWDEALFFGALLHLGVDDRTGRPRQIAVKARELESWLFPSGRMPHPGRDWHKLPEALRRVDEMRICLPAIGAVRVVAIDLIPRGRDGYASFLLTIPSGAAPGPRIDWQTLVRYRARSGPAYRAYLASQVILDRTTRRGRPAGTEPHPLAHTVPSFTARDLADIIAITHPHRAVEAFRLLHDDSIIELVEERRGRSRRFRIYGAVT